jgi:hypothetical protein
MASLSTTRKEKMRWIFHGSQGPLSSVRTVLVLEQAGLKKKEPTLTDFCVYLAGATLPME